MFMIQIKEWMTLSEIIFNTSGGWQRLPIAFSKWYTYIIPMSTVEFPKCGPYVENTNLTQRDKVFDYIL